MDANVSDVLISKTQNRQETPNCYYWQNRQETPNCYYWQNRQETDSVIIGIQWMLITKTQNRQESVINRQKQRNK